MMKLSFEKYAGCGNDFVIIDHRKNALFSPTPDLIKSLCHRQKGIGADGVILLEASHRVKFRMRIYNADGSEAEMCGNGLRCLAHFIQQRECQKNEFTIETMHHSLNVQVMGEMVSVHMPPIGEWTPHIALSIEGKTNAFHFLNTGVPHVVQFTHNLDDENLMKMAPQVRSHPRFMPQGTNVNFAKIDTDHTIYIRTYERGVEAETLSCGTGALAVALAAAKLHQLPSPITVRTRSQENMKITFNSNQTEVLLRGPVKKIYAGEISYEQ